MEDEGGNSNLCYCLPIPSSDRRSTPHVWRRRAEALRFQFRATIDVSETSLKYPLSLADSLSPLGGGLLDELCSVEFGPRSCMIMLSAETSASFSIYIKGVRAGGGIGLIIDAFGELRDQLQSVVDDMGKDYFDKVHAWIRYACAEEHNLANYMFFLMHLINKTDTEYTGQETYVWEFYQQRCWDFFPVSDCFRKQYEDELMGGTS
ncbi:ryanodine receptor [Trichonephila clavipes]|nr:ryanodine receptor [Trichonephila clavipes]